MQNGHSSARTPTTVRYRDHAAGSTHASPAAASGTCSQRSHEAGTPGGAALAVHEARADGKDGCARAVGDLELAEDGRHM